MQKQVIGGSHVRLSVVDNVSGGLGTIVDNDVIVSSFGYNINAPLEPVVGCGSNYPQDTVSGIRSGTFNMNVYLTADPNNKSATVERLEKFHKIIGGDHSSTAVITIYTRGKQDASDRDSYVVARHILEGVVFGTFDVSYSADNTRTTATISGNYNTVRAE